MLLTTIRRIVATIGLAYLVAFATNWWAWHPSETSGLKTALTTDLGLNWGTAGWAILSIIVMVWGVLDKRRWTTLVGYIALAIALTTGVFVTRGVTADLGLTMRMVGVALLGVALFLMAIWPSKPEFRHVAEYGWITKAGDRRTLAAGQPGRAQRTAQRLNAWGLGLERRFRNWRSDRKQRAAERAADAALPDPILDEDNSFATARSMPVPAPNSPVVDHSTIPAASASGSNPS